MSVRPDKVPSDTRDRWRSISQCSETCSNTEVYVSRFAGNEITTYCPRCNKIEIKVDDIRNRKVLFRLNRLSLKHKFGYFIFSKKGQYYVSNAKKGVIEPLPSDVYRMERI